MLDPGYIEALNATVERLPGQIEDAAEALTSDGNDFIDSINEIASLISANDPPGLDTLEEAIELASSAISAADTLASKAKGIKKQLEELAATLEELIEGDSDDDDDFDEEYDEEDDDLD